LILQSEVEKEIKASNLMKEPLFYFRKEGENN